MVVEYTQKEMRWEFKHFTTKNQLAQNSNARNEVQKSYMAYRKQIAK